MIRFLIYFLVYAGSALMAYNVYSYVAFSKRVRKQGNWEQEQRLLNLPILLLVLFLFGYLLVGIAGNPDLIIAGILFGGSIFVFVMLLLIRRIFVKIQENEHLKAKLSAAEEASKAKTFFLSNMSHDIRTPLNAILGYTTLAKREAASQNDRRDYIGKIEKAGHQLLDIVNDVLEMSRIESGKLALDPDRMNLEECIQEAGDLVKNQMQEKQIVFSITCDIIHKWVLCDKNLLNRALMNLLCNACKFTGEKGAVSLALKELSETDELGNYEIHVKDTGIGMDPVFVEHLFTPFEREKTSTVSKTQGTGLGMAITKSIMDLMSGEIEVHTEKDKGTEFVISVSFPIIQPLEESPAESKADLSFDGMRALLVEDNAINLEIAQMLLTQSGFQIETAENGQAAVDMVAKSEAGYYDVVLMDIQMPVMDGYTAARTIRSLPDPKLAAVPIVAMTANAFQEDVQKAQEAGMNDHIAKPIDIPGMMATLNAVLQGKSGE